MALYQVFEVSLKTNVLAFYNITFAPVWQVNVFFSFLPVSNSSRMAFVSSRLDFTPLGSSVRVRQISFNV